MELRKHVSKPVRFDEDYDAHETPRPATKPAFRKMMAARIIPFNPDNPPAAFPSLPLDRPATLPATGTCPETLSGFVPGFISEGVSHTAISSNSLASPVLQQHNDAVEVAQHPNGPTISPQVQMNLESPSRAPEETFPDDGHALSGELWLSLPLSLQYHIYKRMPIFYPEQDSLGLLGLTDSQFDDLLSMARVRGEMEFTEVQLWNICARTSALCDGNVDITGRGCVSELGNETLSALNLRNTVGSFTADRETFSARGTAPFQQDFRSSPRNESSRLPVEPEILTQNLEQLVLASNYELAYEAELNRAELFLITCHVTTAVLGTWVPDGAIGDESEFFTFLPEGSAERLGWPNGYSTALQNTDPGYVASWKRGWPTWQPSQPSQSTSLVAQGPYIKGSTGGNVPLAQQHESPLRSRKVPASLMSSVPQSFTVTSTTNDPCIPCSPVLSPPNLPESIAIISPSTHRSNSITTQGDHAASVGGILQVQRDLRETEALTLSREVEDEEAVTSNPISLRILHISFLTLKFKSISEFRKVLSRSTRRESSQLASLPAGREAESPKTPERQGGDTSAAFVSLKYTPTKSMKLARERYNRPAAATAPSTPLPKEFPGSPFRSTAGEVKRKRTISSVEASPTEISMSSRPKKRVNTVGFPMSLEISQFTTLLPIPPNRARQTLQSQVDPQPVWTTAPMSSHHITPQLAAPFFQTTSQPLEFAAELFMPLRQPSCSPIPENKGNDEIEAFLSRHAAPIRFNTQTGVVHTEQTSVPSTNQNSQPFQ